LWLVDLGPGINPSLEGLIFPDLESLVINDRGLDYFFSSEYTPGDGIDVFFSNVLRFVAVDIDGLVGDFWELIEVCNKLWYKSCRDEQLKVSFLVNVAILWSPSVFSVS